MMLRFILPVLGMALLPAFAAQAAGEASLGYDSSKPIEVNADNFVADLNGEKGTYNGHVVVRQGVVQMSADAVTVSAPGGKASRMDAAGHVVVATPTGNAIGEKGTYDVPGRLLHLTGNVVLTKGKNVMRGQALDVAMATGEAKLVAGGGQTSTAGRPANGGRVQSLFVPKSANSESGGNP